MNKKFYLLSLFVLAFTFIACNKDDDNPTSVPARDRGEQQIVDNDSLIGYLETHYYNSSDFISNSNPRISDINITELPTDDDGNYLPLPDPANNTLLIDAVETRSTVYADIEYQYYLLKLNQGGGNEMPNFASNIRVNYSGNTQDNVVFDSTVNPI